MRWNTGRYIEYSFHLPKIPAELQAGLEDTILTDRTALNTAHTLQVNANQIEKGRIFRREQLYYRIKNCIELTVINLLNVDARGSDLKGETSYGAEEDERAIKLSQFSQLYLKQFAFRCKPNVGISLHQLYYQLYLLLVINRNVHTGGRGGEVDFWCGMETIIRTENERQRELKSTTSCFRTIQFIFDRSHNNTLTKILQFIIKVHIEYTPTHTIIYINIFLLYLCGQDLFGSILRPDIEKKMTICGEY